MKCEIPRNLSNNINNQLQALTFRWLQFLYRIMSPLVWNSFVELFLLVWLCSLTASGFTDLCHKIHPGFNYYLGTKTPYRFVANYDDKPIVFPGCHPTRILGIVRHGTRTPGWKFVNKMKRLNDLKSLIMNFDNNVPDRLCNNETQKLQKWNLYVEDEEEKILTHEGEDEMLELAERFQNRFPSLMTSNYSDNIYLFKYTATQRTHESAKYFTIGLFGRKTSRYISFPEPLHKDPILRFYKLCTRWRRDVKENPATLEELNMYKIRLEVTETLESVSKRIGLNYTLPYDDVHIMYTTCCFETAWRKHKTSPWCSVFSENDLKVMEFAEDLKYYWRDGYGYDINHRQACPVVKNLFSHLKKETKTPVIFYFTHSGTLLKLISHLGLYKDNFKLNHDISQNLKDVRRWRVSAVDTFGTNLVFASYDCNGEDKVLILHQERIVNLPGCPKDEPCLLSHLEHMFEGSLKSCDFDSMCSLKN